MSRLSGLPRIVFLVVLLLVLMLLFFVPPALSQVYPAIETFLGFSLNNNEYGTQRNNSPGVHLSMGFNPRRSLRLLGDFALQYHDSNILWWNNEKARVEDFQLLFGPELVFRQSRKVTPFLHALAGVASRNYAVPTGIWEYDPFTGFYSPVDYSIDRDWGFAGGAGGGLDVNVSGMLALRVFQFDYLPTHVTHEDPFYMPPQGNFPVTQGWQHNYRVAVGVVFRFGQRGRPQ